MKLTPGTRLGPYEIVSSLGAGGMGEVWRAHDERLDRFVAVKVLSPAFAADEQARRRFQREARTISQLRHPHICTLYDVGENYLVMELVAGESLADKLAKGPLSVEQIVRYGIEIADALAAAHKSGVVHRDVKPANIMLTESGVKLLDFGLAKAAEPVVAADAPTDYKPLTEEGTILGTVQYMAPEQLEGNDIDARTDVFALGLVLYEMATGKRAFSGKSKPALIAAILKDQPRRISELQPFLPSALEHVVQACLAKDPRDRWQHAGDVAVALRWIVKAEERRASESPAEPLPSMRFEVRLDPPEFLEPLRDIPSYPMLSPDGRHFAFVSRGPSDDRNWLWLRSLERVAPYRIDGTEDASFPFWSPDSQHIGFFSEQKLKRIPVTGGAARVVCDAESGRGGTWSASGVIVFARNYFSGLYRVPASGGTATALTHLETPRETSHRWPCFLPDQRRFLYFSYLSLSEDERDTNGGICVGSLDGAAPRRLLAPASNMQVVSDQILFFRGGNLLAQRFDLSTIELLDEPVPVEEGVGHHAEKHLAYFSASSDGVIAYSGAREEQVAELHWRGRDGADLGTVGEPSVIGNFRLSPDDRQLAVSIGERRVRAASIWLHDFSREMETRLTAEPAAVDDCPVWSPRSDAIAFAGARGMSANVFLRRLESGTDEMLHPSDRGEYACDWSSDGRWIACVRQRRESDDQEICLVAPTGGEPVVWRENRFNNLYPQFSPDGQWMAFVSTESGQRDVYIARVQAPANKWRISARGGDQPRWRGDGRELFYIAPDDQLMAVPIALDPEFRTDAARALFRVRRTLHGNTPTDYDVTRDGQRFLVRTAPPHGLAPVTIAFGCLASLSNAG